ncbi:MAG: DegT/DnrJ/EryC1/StrS family aminotransferase, partial [Atribacterota bacterium]|nr:DegT/DnrJ/EryC1/StrS family aminotransferase [Atribacterota bacterium]
NLVKKHKYSKNSSIRIVNDAARCCGGGYKGKRVGSRGWVTIFSFQSQKHMTTLGEGGMITTNDLGLADRLRNMRLFGGENDWGSNYKMTKIQAAVGLVQLRRLNKMNSYRRKIALQRSKLLGGTPEIILPTEPSGYKHIYYTYSILVNPDWAGKKRDKIISIMREKFGIVCSVSNPPTYLRWPYIAKKCGTPKLKTSDDVGKRLFCLPLHPLLNKSQELYICASLLETIDLIKK